MNDTDGDPGVADADHLRELTEALIGHDPALDEVVARISGVLGAQIAIDAVTVAAGFNGITRVADATGIPLDESTAERTAAMRETTGIERFNYTEKSERYA